MNTGTLKWTGPQQSRLPSLDTDRRRDFVPKRRAAADEKVSYTDAKRKLTGDGDIMMRFLPCYQAVESLRRGMTPREAAEDAVRRMVVGPEARQRLVQDFLFGGVPERETDLGRGEVRPIAGNDARGRRTPTQDRHTYVEPSSQHPGTMLLDPQPLEP